MRIAGKRLAVRMRAGRGQGEGGEGGGDESAEVVSQEPHRAGSVLEHELDCAGAVVGLAHEALDREGGLHAIYADSPAL